MSIFRKVLLMAAAGFMIGCSLGREAAIDGKLEIVSMTLLPDIESTKHYQFEKPRVIIRVMPDGRVDEARILNPSGDDVWDTAAVDSIRKWRFARLGPATALDGSLYRLVLDIRPIDDPAIYTIGELRTPSEAIADSLYRQLKEGVDFFDLADLMQEELYRTDDTAYFLRSMELSNYPDHVRRVIQRLNVDEFSKPVKTREYWVIYKRFKTSSIDLYL